MYEESAVSITVTKLCQELATVPDQTAVRALLREFKQMKGAASTGYRTILGYNADGHDIRVNYYSNPAVTHPITGTPTNPMGTTYSVQYKCDTAFSSSACHQQLSQ